MPFALGTKHIPLHAACRIGNLYKAKKRLEEDAKRVNELDPQSDKSPLYLAVENDHEDLVQFLLAKRADVNQPCTPDRISPIELARRDSKDKIAALLAAGGPDGSISDLTSPKFKTPSSKEIKATVEADVPAAQSKVYYLAVVTGSLEDCGTDANVMCTLCGEQATSGIVMLQNSEELKLFRPGQTDIFCLKLPDLGALTHIRIGHDSQRDDVGWYVEKVIVTEDDLIGGERATEFYAGRWLHPQKEDGQNEVLLQGELWV